MRTEDANNGDPRHRDRNRVPVPGVDRSDLSVLQSRLEAVVDIYRRPGKITHADIIGTLEIVKLNLFYESCDDEDDLLGGPPQ